MRLFKQPIVRLIISLISLILVYNLSRSILDLWARRSIISERKLVLENLELKHAKLQDKLTLATSSAFLEKQAREKLGMVREGETLVLVNQPEKPNQVDSQQNQNIPNWQKWWRIFIN